MVGMTWERNYVIGFLLPPPNKKDSKEREREGKKGKGKGNKRRSH